MAVVNGQEAPSVPVSDLKPGEVHRPPIPRDKPDVGGSDQLRVTRSPASGTLPTLMVPRVEIDIDNPGREMNLSQWMLSKIRRPGRLEWFKIAKGHAFTTRLLVFEKGMDKDYCYVDPAIEEALEDEISDVLVIPFFSLDTHSWAMWILKVSDLDWFRSAQVLTNLPDDLCDEKAFRVVSDKRSASYRVKTKPFGPVDPPSKSIEEMLGSAVTRISSLDHPYVQKLMEGDFFV